MRNLSIRWKLVLIIGLVSNVTVLLACATLVVFDWNASRDAMVERMTTLAGVVGNNSVASLEFGDARTAREILAELETEPNIKTAAIYGADRRVLAFYQQGGGQLAPTSPEPEGYRFEEEFLIVFRPVIYREKQVGTIHLSSDLRELDERLGRYVAVVGAVVVGASVVSLLLAILLQGVISRPITRLADVAQAVSRHQNYALRAEPHGQDELGKMIAGFNDMLEQIQSRDSELQGTHDQLQQRAEQLQQELSERLRAEEARENAERELEAQRTLSLRADRLRSLGEMAAGIAHELNQPLMGVRGLAEHMLIAMEREWTMDEEHIRDRLERIVEQSDRMVHIIDHVRRFAGEAGRSDVAPIQVDGIVESAVSLLGAQFKAHGLDLAIESAGNLPPVLANAFSLEEVVINLLSNSRDAVESRSAADGRQGRVVVRTSSPDSTQVCIEVEDNGSGIPESIIAKVFDPFFTTKDPDKGTGLGLAISRTIVEESDGQLILESTPDQGTRATVVLPIAEIVRV
ncbi:MAG: HAMP domain-containing protein [Gemmatimonadetes bacterium]|jgi:two-component system, sensor histidine kinase|nr:HAMP domain-containing protein [Gemmatimonadota bacterium]MBT5963503.1 HAMP domain-containing protein [Gemmatimonadota bacterium]